ncbi:hypothetical protein AU252_19845 [Pseudarthrobacter sulfonivorans]|uniref:Uncharacterized protein n=1 Tax=Pseudarthrobacter sulfonivorans TaxID=121292 RepID=A0A0U3QF90_9MICC|nr:hypothetical protein [Pseudarthrobacter sulfonivorans]ALV43133.1 hypothetical protein AU252_19845 [Pseudarthrobacter sulfonivorans]
MTEQPVETEEQFLGNEPKQALAAAVTALPGLPLTEGQQAVLDKAMQHYVPNAHLRRPSWSPVDDVELAALVRKSVNANRLLAIAKAGSVKAETALQLALNVEDEASTAAHEAEKALLTFTRKDTGL